ncbi:MAG TPA: PaaI family thioesterase [Candidatus Dormibacteraeota bacterium]|nr:PaaI family thioesterase [Candidatus Dormibacteraeota bacterium]
MEVTYDGRCFGCGRHNPDGLQMSFERVGEESVCELEVAERFQSWQGLVHGGVIALMLDEAVGWAGWQAGFPGLTGRLEVRYRQPLRPGERVRVVGRVERVRRSLVDASARVERVADGARIAEASATLITASAEVVGAS